MACGCGDRCTCSVVGGEGVTVTGSGDATDPFIVSAPETVFAATSAGNTIAITPSGAAGHSPNLDVNISPNAGNVIQNAGNGLFAGSSTIINAIFPIGMSIEITHDQALPAGLLDEDGDEYDVLDYAALAAAYGATGVGDGLWDTHPQFGAPAAGFFRVPDSQVRAVYNAGGTFVVGDDDTVALATRTPNHVHTGPSHTHTGPSHTHTFTPSGTNSTTALSTDASVGTEPANFHTGYIVRESGRTKLVGGADGLVSVDLAPTGAGSADAFAKMNHSHDIGAHGHTFTGTADNTGAAGTGATGAAGTGATGTKSPGHIIYRRAVWAGV